MELSVNVAIKPHLKKFLVKVYGTDVIKVHHRDMIGVIIVALLDKNYSRNEKHEMKDTVENVQFIIHYDKAVRAGFNISRQSTAVLNNYLDSLFRFLFYDMVSRKLQQQAPSRGFYRNEARSFFKFYGIEEDDFSLDSFLKDVYRTRKDPDKYGANCPFRIGQFQLYLHSNKHE